MSEYLSLPESAVLERSSSGQSELLAARMTLNPLERRLLSIVTGYTPLSRLQAFVGDAVAAMQAARRLVELELLREARNTVPRPSRARCVHSVGGFESAYRRYDLAHSGSGS